MDAAPMRFIDTSHWLACLHPGDEFHDVACAWDDALAGQPAVTTDWVLAELIAIVTVRAPRQRPTCIELIDAIRDRDSAVEVVHVDPALRDASWNLLKAHPRTTWSWTDAAAIALMRNRGITEALSTDRGFFAAKLVPLLRTSAPPA